jgi:hypothetical protein
MLIEFDKSFVKSLDKIRNPLINRRLEHIIAEFDKAIEIQELKNVKKLVGF